MKNSILIKGNLLIAFLLLFFVSSTFSENNGDQISSMKQYIDSAGKDPIEYVSNKIKQYDIVVLYQFMHFKHEFDFINSLIPVLQKEGINNLAIEFGNYQDQVSVDKLVSSNNFDESLARNIMFNFRKYGIWGYEEYLDIFRNVWKINKNISKGGKKFRLILLGSSNLGVDKDYDIIIKREILDSKEKVFVCTSRFYNFSEKSEINNKIFTIMISSPLCLKNLSNNNYFYIKPFNGVIDKALTEKGSSAVAFDLDKNIFIDIKEKNYVNYENSNCLKIQTDVDGFIFLCGYNEYETMTWIDNFINEDNFLSVKKYFLGKNSELKVESIQYANDLCCANDYTTILKVRKLMNNPSIQVN